jgi:hypothetical protein
VRNGVTTSSDCSLLKHDNSDNSHILGYGWSERQIVKFGKILNALILEHNDGRFAVCYYDYNNTYIGDDVSKLSLTQKEWNLLVGLIFQEIFSELAGNSASNILINLLKKKNFSVQVKKMIDLTRAKGLSEKIVENEKEMLSLLSVPGRDVQDNYVANSHENASVKVSYNDDEYIATHGLILSGFTLAYPFKNSQGEFFIIFEQGGYHGREAAFDFSRGFFCQDSDKRSKATPQIFLHDLIDHIAACSGEIMEYFSQTVISNSGILRSPHIGHNLWNDLTGVCRLESNHLLEKTEEILLVGGEQLDVWLELEDIFSYDHFNRDILSWEQLRDYVYENRILPIRIADEYITTELSTRIIEGSNKISPLASQLLTDEVRVVLGLRTGNRTWLNQKSGLIEIIKYLEKKYKKLTILVDGRNASLTSGKIIVAPHESNKANDITLEKEIVVSLQEEFVNTNVQIIDLIGEPVATSVAWISKANFFIAPWGAGLAKYKWVCNLPGVILSSSWNLKNRRDLKIYEDRSFRESATSCIYVDEFFVEDQDCATNLIKTKKVGEHPSLADFIVDVEGIKLAIDKLLLDLDKSNEL